MVNVNENQDKLYNERKAICEACPLYKTIGDRVICNPNLYLNTDTGETSEIPRIGFQKGCGCQMQSKWSNEGSFCSLGKW